MLPHPRGPGHQNTALTSTPTHRRQPPTHATNKTDTTCRPGKIGNSTQTPRHIPPTTVTHPTMPQAGNGADQHHQPPPHQKKGEPRPRDTTASPTWEQQAIAVEPPQASARGHRYQPPLRNMRNHARTHGRRTPQNRTPKRPLSLEREPYTGLHNTPVRPKPTLPPQTPSQHVHHTDVDIPEQKETPPPPAAAHDPPKPVIPASLHVNTKPTANPPSHNHACQRRPGPRNTSHTSATPEEYGATTTPAWQQLAALASSQRKQPPYTTLKTAQQRPATSQPHGTTHDQTPQHRTDAHLQTRQPTSQPRSTPEAPEPTTSVTGRTGHSTPRTQAKPTGDQEGARRDPRGSRFNAPTCQTT